MKAQELKRKNVTLIIIVTIWFIISNINFANIDMLSNNEASNNNGVTKKGGIAFRTDDNWKSDDFYALADTFSNYNAKYSLALNLGASEFDDVSYQDSIAFLQTLGVEIMDHTPNHRTNYFETKFDSLEYVNTVSSTPINGIDHIIKISDSTHKICLAFQDADTTKALRSGTCDINKDTLTGSFSNFTYFDDIYLYFPTLNTLVFIKSIYSNKTKIIVKDLWEDSIDLGTQLNIPYFNFTRANIELTIVGITVLASETQKLADEYEFATQIVSWVQPGGRHPVISMAELSQALTPLGYTAGASFGEVQSLKSFNEYDPSDIKKFGMQWEDFNEDHSDRSLRELKTQISDGIAKHNVLIGHNHFYTLTGSNNYVTKTEYYDRVGKLLAWADSNSIDVKTYSEWAEKLYKESPDPYENIFPPLNVNYDDSVDAKNPNGVPDGYYPKNWDHGVWTKELDPENPNVDNYCYAADSWSSRIFLVQDLAGIYKGENEFKIWVKGHPTDSIKIIFSFPYNAYSSLEYLIPVTSSSWMQYSLLNSTNSITPLDIPVDVSRMNVEVRIKYHNPANDSLKVTEMYLAKKKPELQANLTIQLEGAYEGGSEMDVESGFFNNIPMDQPFDVSPWDFNDDVDDLTSIPSDVIDWVLVELRNNTTATSIETRKAAFVNEDGEIVNLDGNQFTIEVAEGNYYIVIHQRNHLPIMSKTEVLFSLN